MGPWRGAELKSDTSESAASRREAATDDGLGEPESGNNEVGTYFQVKTRPPVMICVMVEELRPVEASWKSGSVRWRTVEEGFLAEGLVSVLSPTGILLLSSVSL